MKILELINLGVDQSDDIQKIRLIRQANGLNLFYVLFALSGFILLKLFVQESFYLQMAQLVALAGYISSLFLSFKRFLSQGRILTIIVFELQLFLIILFSNMLFSPVIFMVVLIPLLASLLEVSIVGHTLAAMFGVVCFILIHYFLPGAEAEINRFFNLDQNAVTSIIVLALLYTPIMASVIISIIFRENIRAREKQKEMLNQITLANRQLEIYTERLKDESQRLLAEVNIAKKIQTMVLPLSKEINKIEDLEIALIMRPADEVGGDYYDVIKLDDVITIGIGDVTGHGLSSGIIMLMAQTAIRTLVEMKITDPRMLITILNRVLYSNITRINERKNMTLMIITYIQNKFVVSGQHESIIICRKDGTIEMIDTLELGFYVGLLPDIEENLSTYEFKLEKDDLMVLYSDGVTEAMNEKGQQFGLDLFCQQIQKNRDLPAQKIKYKIIENLYNYMGNTLIYDDISLVIIKQK